MTADQQKPPSEPVERARADTAEGSIQLRIPQSEEARAAGVVLHFDWTEAGGDATVTGDVSQGPSGLTVTRAEVSVAGPSGITRDLLRSMPLGDVVAHARAYMRKREQLPPSITASAGEARVTSGRTPMTDDLLREVALAFIRETGPGKGRGATQRMMDHFGRPQGTVQTWIKRARKEGWLAPGPPGRMGAEMGPKLRSWVGRTMREHEPVEREASRIAEAIGLEKAGQYMDALDAYDDEAERVLANRIDVHPLAACLAAQVLFGQSLRAELTERSSRTGATEETSLEEIAQEMQQTLADKGITVNLDEG